MDLFLDKTFPRILSFHPLKAFFETNFSFSFWLFCQMNLLLPQVEIDQMPICVSIWSLIVG